MQSASSPITAQPTPGRHTVHPSAPPDGLQLPNTTYQPGLESLTHLDKICIDQRVEPTDAGNGFEFKIRYVILDENGSQLFHMKESSKFIQRLCCSYYREITITVYDNQNQPILRFYRPFIFFSGYLEVWSGARSLGTIREHHCKLSPTFDLYNELGNKVFEIKGPCCGFYCHDQQYEVLPVDSSYDEGRITKKWTGTARDFTRFDFFELSFPRNLSLDSKVLLIAATILIDFRHHE